MPETVFELSKSYLLGLFRFHIIIEDRNPGQTSNYRYKTQINVNIFMTKFSYISHSMNTGVFIVNGKSSMF